MVQAVLSETARAEMILDSMVQEFMAPGIQYVAVDAKRTLFAYAGGLADVAAGKPVNASTTMMSYSMTKPVTAAAVLQLVERYRVRLDDRVSYYLPCNPYGDFVLVRHLLAQTSGIPDPLPLRWVHPPAAHPGFNEDAALSEVLKKYPKLEYEPGSRTAYSNIAYWLLGKIVETTSGRPFPDYIRENIFRPLGIPESLMAFVIPDPANHAKGYLEKVSLINLARTLLIDRKLIGEYEGRWRHVLDHYPDGPSFGGIVAAAAGYSVFLQDQLRDESVLFDSATKRLFFSEQSAGGNPSGTTLGWHIGRLNNATEYYYKEGGGGGYHGEMRLYPGQRIATVIMTNNAGFRAAKQLNALDRLFLL